MLPPVPATSVAHAMQANQRQASTQQVAPEASAQDGASPTAARAIAPGSTSSMELLGLSGQMRLSQSLSVFAETLGSLLKLPRREGEALADYSKRLAAAINALNTTERARLQAQLNQIMQGATLRLLAEMLKDPSGPAAARLAVQIEIAQYQERDLAARHVVSSYRQNNGSELPLLPINRPANGNATGMQPAFLAAGVEAESGASATMPQNVPDIDTAGSAAKSTPSAADMIIEDDNSRTLPKSGDTTVAAAGRPMPPTVQHIGDGETADSQTAGSLEGSTLHVDDASAAEMNNDQAFEANTTRPSRSPALSTASGNPVTPPATLPANAGGAVTRSAAIYDAAALARQAHDHTDLHTRVDAPAMAKVIIDRFQVEWVADLFTGEPETKEVRRIPPAQIAALNMATDAEAGGTAAEGAPATKTVPVSARAQDDQTPEPQISVLPLPTTTTSTQASVAAPAVSDSAFEKALLGMSLLPRDLPAHPVVPHAGAPDFKESENHEIKRKPPVGDDQGQSSRREHPGGEHPPGGEHAGSEQHGGEDPQAEPASPQDDSPDFAVAENESTAAGMKQAPRQHLTNHPATGPEDFYRRLAALE